MGRFIGIVLAVSLIAPSVAAQAPSGAPPASPSQTVPQPGHVLNEDEIRQKLREEGYAEVTELRLQGPSYEAKAVKDGRNVNLTVDARTGSIRSTY
jgi:Peptidase propeptide and YPEB domain